MPPLGFINGESVPTVPVSGAEQGIRLRFEEALGCGSRYWIRGQVLHAPTEPEGRRGVLGWWKRKSRSEDRPTHSQTAHIETRIGGTTVANIVTLDLHGAFSVRMSAESGVARKGWRMARNRVNAFGASAEKCALVVMPPESSPKAVAVILPFEYTLDQHGIQRFAESSVAATAGESLHRLQTDNESAPVFYYLAAVSCPDDTHHSQLALATTTLGWPRGSFIVVSVSDSAKATEFAGTLDDLRWLLSESLSLSIINMESKLDPLLTTQIEPKHDRAEVVRYLGPTDRPESLLAENRTAPATVINRSRATKTQRLPRYPVVFCHGMLAFSTLRMQLPDDLNSFSPLRPFLAERGLPALFPQVAPTSGIIERAKQLKEQISRWTNEKVNLIAHSMGGLDARYIITHLGMADRVKSLTTIATPHQGTSLADWLLANFHKRVPLLLALETLGANIDGFRDCCPGACKEFNERTPNMPGVSYFSFAGCVPPVHVTPMLRRAYSLLMEREGPNDGMISVKSAHWGEYLGTLHADHYAQTPDMVFVRPGEDFDALGFYFRLLEDLARRGF